MYINKLKILTALIIFSLSFSVSSATDYEPNTKWPYVFEDFMEGKVYLNDTTKIDARLNIHLQGNRLHYIMDNDIIMEYDGRKIVRVEIADMAFLFVDNQVMQIVGTDGTDLVVMLSKADFSFLQPSTGAYGASLNSSAINNLSSLELGGLNNPQHGRMLQEKYNGKTIPVTKEYYFVIDGRALKATKSSVNEYLGKDKATQFKAFLKENKVSWKAISGLNAILAFLNGIK